MRTAKIGPDLRLSCWKKKPREKYLNLSYVFVYCVIKREFPAGKTPHLVCRTDQEVKICYQNRLIINVLSVIRFKHLNKLFQNAV